MPKKINFDKIAKKIETVANTIDIVMRNRLIIAIFLIVDGITFLLNPDTTLAGIAQNIIMIIGFAAFSVFIANLARKEKDTKTIIISLAVIAAAIFFYIYPDIIAAYMQLLLALFIIGDGITNIASILHWTDKLSKYTKAVSDKFNRVIKRKKPSEEKAQKNAEQREKFKEIDDNINASLEEQKQKMVTPLKNLVNKANKSSALYIAANATTIILGLILLIFPDVSMMIWGLIFLYTGCSNLIVSIKTMDLSRKIKEKKFKEILFENEEPYAKKKPTAKKS